MKISKKKVALAVVDTTLSAVNTAYHRRIRRENEALKNSLLMVSGTLAEVEALYRKEFARKPHRTQGSADGAAYTEGWEDGRDNLLADLDLILHPDTIQEWEIREGLHLDSEGFVVKDGDRG